MKFEQIGKEVICRMPKLPSGSLNAQMAVLVALQGKGEVTSNAMFFY